MDTLQTPFWAATGAAILSLIGNVVQGIAQWRKARSESERAETESHKLRSEIEQSVLENLLRLNREAQEASDKRYQQLRDDNEELWQAKETLEKSNIELQNRVTELDGRLGRIEGEYKRTIAALQREWDAERRAFTKRQELMSEEVQEFRRAFGNGQATRKKKG